MLTMELTTWDGRSCRLPTLLSWTFTYTGGVPCDSMTACCPYDTSMAEVLPDATRFAALRDGAVMLRGVVDAYEISLSGQGLLVTLEGRGMAALLMDNESEALTYGTATIGDILRNHVEPYGITVERGSALSGDSYAVTSGSSQWKALRGFTHRYGGFDPYFTRDGSLVIRPLWGSGGTLTVDERTPLLSLRRREDRYGVISEVLIQDKTQDISHRVVNEDFAAKGGCRRHVLYMPRSTAGERRYTGEYQIAQSALEQLAITLELPLPFAAFPGDRVQLALGRLGPGGAYDVTEVRCILDEAGERTEIVLSRR